MNEMKNAPLVPITDVLSFIVDNRGKTVPTAESGFPLIATNCVHNERLYPVFENIRYVSEYTLHNWFRAELKANYILFVNKGTPGRCCLVPDPVSFCAAQDMIGLRCDEQKVYYRYLLMVLRSTTTQKFISNYHVGIAIPHFKKEDLSKLLIPLPSMEYQKRIGDLYFDICEKEEHNNSICADLEAMAKLLYDYWFVQFDFPDENGKPYKSSGGKMVWNEELKREIPEGWEAGTFGDCIASINTGLNPRDNFKLNTGGTIRYLTVKNLTKEGTVDFSSCDCIDEEARAIVHRRSDIRIGDILFASIAPLGRCYVIKEDPKTWDINESVFSIRPNYKIATSNFLYMTFMSDSFVKKAEGSSTGSVFKGIRISELQDLKTIIPKKAVLDKFDDVVEKLFAAKSNAFNENMDLASLRDFLLPMLMNGQVKVCNME